MPTLRHIIQDPVVAESKTLLDGNLRLPMHDPFGSVQVCDTPSVAFPHVLIGYQSEILAQALSRELLHNRRSLQEPGLKTAPLPKAPEPQALDPSRAGQMLMSQEPRKHTAKQRGWHARSDLNHTLVHASVLHGKKA